MTTASRIFGNPEAGIDYVKKLEFENANAACQAAIRPYRKKTVLSGYIRHCADIGPSFHQGIAVAAALKDMTIHEWFEHKQKKSGKGWFKCGLEGHFAQNCPGSNIIQKGPHAPGLCPRCHHGNHWRNGCHSKRDDKGTPLVPQGNGIKGQHRALNPTKQVYRATLNKNPFVTSKEQPQEVQYWTSMPPPTHY